MIWWTGYGPRGHHMGTGVGDTVQKQTLFIGCVNSARCIISLRLSFLNCKMRLT